VPLTAPDTLYLTWTSSQTGQLRSGIIRLTDRGAGVQRFDYTTVLGSDPMGMGAVDRQDTNRIFLRVFGAECDRLALSEDGGATVRVVLEASRSLAGLVARPDGVVFAAGRDVDTGSLHVSRDGGLTFPGHAPGPALSRLGACRGNPAGYGRPPARRRRASGRHRRPPGEGPAGAPTTHPRCPHMWQPKGSTGPCRHDLLGA